MPTAASGAAPASSAASPINARSAGAGVPDNPPGLLGSNAKPAGGSGILPNVRITADVTNNAVLVYANQESQRIVEQTIRQIDRPQRQIAIEATIAEVTLNDTLNYGVQFFLASRDVGLKPDTVAELLECLKQLDGFDGRLSETAGPGGPKSGSESFNWRHFDGPFGAVVRSVNAVG